MRTGRFVNFIPGEKSGYGGGGGGGGGERKKVLFASFNWGEGEGEGTLEVEVLRACLEKAPRGKGGEGRSVYSRPREGGKKGEKKVGRGRFPGRSGFKGGKIRGESNPGTRHHHPQGEKGTKKKK